jgi:putative ABC transport system permease protein
VALDMAPAPQIYIPVLQEPQLSSVSLVVRASSDRPAVAGAVRQELHRIDKNLPVYDVRPLADRVAESIAPRRFNMLLMSLLAAVALALAAVGIYGVISYMVGERVHEIGIRMALGARPPEILRLVVRQGMTHAIIGIAGGLMAALVLTKAMSGLLFGVQPIDGFTFGAVASVTAIVAFLACLVPALRASNVDPARALRCR